MRYAHIVAAVTEERWALRESKLQEILAFLQDQAAGAKLSAEEIEARITKVQEQAIARRDGAVAVLPLRGVIASRMNLMSDISGGTSAEGFGRMFQAALRDEGVKAIVLDVDSPGGAVSGADELSTMIHAARGPKPIVAQVDATAASAAYWIASAADEMVVTPTGSVGSIGVFGVHDDVSAAMERMGVRKTLISAGRYKTDGNPYQPLGDDARSRIQARVDAAYGMFVKAVARNRGVSQAAVREGFGQGDMVLAEPAVAEGMADRIGTMEDTLRRFGASLHQPAPSRRRAFATQRERRALSL
ncbi:S49 family peptidase [Rhodoplanes roseus]|uniref:Peptidase S49 n=1 Tax=Rhodoplanes roseus TaxID=29409 RepID=A0A327L4F3_9BRAD|nr:S49 family peptidase [Rhodoplanes roseus]RAI44713.1 peptidase S49 [Rhodoplanes roseus]